MCSFPQNGRSVTLTWVLIVSPIESNSGNWRSDCFKKWIYLILNFHLIWRASFNVCLDPSQCFPSDEPGTGRVMSCSSCSCAPTLFSSEWSIPSGHWCWACQITLSWGSPHCLPKSKEISCWFLVLFMYFICKAMVWLRSFSMQSAMNNLPACNYIDWC